MMATAITATPAPTPIPAIAPAPNCPSVVVPACEDPAASLSLDDWLEGSVDTGGGVVVGPFFVSLGLVVVVVNDVCVREDASSGVVVAEDSAT
jgi:hypothetical protein